MVFPFSSLVPTIKYEVKARITEHLRKVLIPKRSDIMGGRDRYRNLHVIKLYRTKHTNE